MVPQTHTLVWFRSVSTKSEANSNAIHLICESHSSDGCIKRGASPWNEEQKLLKVALYQSLIHYILD